jgi:adenylate kinase family enzyme
VNPQLPNFSRVCVVGTSGSGKTTFARKLARLFEAPHIEVDALHWGPNWTVRADFVERVEAAIQQPRWVLDGNYGVVRDRTWRRATAIIWLNYSFSRVFARGLSRTLRRLVTSELLWANNRESWSRALFDPESTPWWIVRTRASRVHCPRMS